MPKVQIASLIKLRQQYVMIFRKLDSVPIYGVIIDISNEMVILGRVTSDYRYDGFSVLRTRDITKVQVVENDIRYRVARFLYAEGVPVPPKCESVSFRRFFESWERAVPLTLFTEGVAANICYIGLMSALSHSSIEFRTIDTRCRLADIEKISLSRITRIDIHRRYDTIVYVGMILGCTAEEKIEAVNGGRVPATTRK